MAIGCSVIERGTRQWRHSWWDTTCWMWNQGCIKRKRWLTELWERVMLLMNKNKNPQALSRFAGQGITLNQKSRCQKYKCNWTKEIRKCNRQGSSSMYLALNIPHLDKAKPTAARKSKLLMHHVGTKPTFIQLQSWQMVCHSGPTGLNPVWFHASTSIPGSITHPSKRCGYFQHLASWAPCIRRNDHSNGWFEWHEWGSHLGWNGM